MMMNRRGLFKTMLAVISGAQVAPAVARLVKRKAVLGASPGVAGARSSWLAKAGGSAAYRRSTNLHIQMAASDLEMAAMIRDKQDVWQEMADRLGVSRQEAKRLSYMAYYSPDERRPC